MSVGVDDFFLPADLDFRAGNCCWGHVMHSDTFVKAPRPGWFARWRDRRNSVRRYSVLIHASGLVRDGAPIKWTGSRGTVEGVVTRVEPLRDPADMYKVWIRVIS